MSDLRVIGQPTRSSGDARDKEIATAVEQLASGFEKLSLAMKSRSWRREGRAGLGPLQRQILSLLRSKQGQMAQVSVIANELVVRMPTASEAVATLERKRLVRRRRTARDGRVVTVELTARGLKACGATAEKPDHLVSAISMLEQAEQSMLLKTLVKVIRTLQERGEISVARMCVSCRFFQPHRYEDADQPHHCEYVNAPFGDPALRLDCREFEPAAREQARDAWLVFTGGRSAIG
ncbi:Transcriptional regulator, MarR family [Nitrospira sp. KM1]|uniref:winged helix DNA-binding protein n=1 Tax=Nitrospira sp. KM1 TaxID=1936990 RepID=UPI0013A76505|nr:winged helix DNA-binding protein [Nitrospira sp. KM1]BCA54553.1 Transcriptional regulator, MarR family [Nitrospira sp. KM1]